MARKISSRLKILGTLTAQTPIHVGGYGESFETDMALAKNGNDEFYVPGTSLTGTLRSWFEDAFVDKNNKETQKFVNEIWGYKDGSEGNASFVLIEDMRLPEDLRDSLQSELRDGVGIDRLYGTAANGAKYDRAILPKGTELEFEMAVEIADRKRKPKKERKNEHDIYAETEPEFNSRIIKTKAMFGHLLEALQNGEIRLGASKTRGLGRVEFKPKKIAENSLKGFDEILKLVQKQSSKTYSIEDLKKENASINPKPNEKVTITIEWQPKSPLMVKAGYDGIGVDTLPLVSANGKEQVSLVLPGSSVKGAFRAHAERILRTFSGKSAKDAKEFHDQIKMDLVNELFGAKKETAKSNLGLGALSIDDCYAEKQMNAEDWQKTEVGEFPNDTTYSATGLHQALKKIDGEANEFPTKAFQISHHTAIDRFTGAASDGALFSVLKPSPTLKWDDLNLTINLSRIPNEKRLCALMLLLLVLRDFAQNRLPLGFATNRGMGEVKDVSFEINGLYNISYKNEQFEFTHEKLKDDMQTAWKNLEV